MHIEKILSALRLLEQELGNLIIQLDSNIAQGRAKIVLNEVFLYIQFNRFGEYGYQIIFSEKENDFARFDNYDTKWNVKTKPHHYHPRLNENAYESPMIGNPEKDIPILSKIIKNKVIWDINTRF